MWSGSTALHNMLVTLAIYIVAILFGMISILLPDFQVLPQAIFDSIHWFFSQLLELDSIFLVISTILTGIVFFLKFLSYFALYKITIKAVNYLRGAGSGLN